MENKEHTCSTPASESSVSSSPEDSKTGSGHAARYAKVYGFFGFNRAYNFPLWVIFAGAMLGFSLSRLPELNYSHFFKEDDMADFGMVPGYWYYVKSGSFRVGMIMHLATILPAGILMVLQFTPIIRHKFITFHRINGYTVLLLILISNAAACMVLRHNHGGGARIAAQSAEAFLVIITTLGLSMAWWNIRCKQVDQHRAWMLRTMFYMGTIITSRFMEFAASPIITRIGGYYGVWSCDEIEFLYTQYQLPFPEQDYPQCFLPDGTLNRAFRVAINAAAIETKPEQLSSSLVQPFGALLWICIVVHLIGVEIYLGMTPREAERLRQVSYEKQLEAGFANPGCAGLTADRWGDAEKWTPKR
ncbi:hypothetical protein BDV95DRAFT_601130 [Massariosphaeria phaeospora]|uniref:Microtubule associated protein n=1 Tax=Massariosphaeria phaeospora TaxID=100035 RepID=A0A7C8IJ51_9PLEO|nr:hypothetical protein BDV95DRAFT_601130 [Massariosphaeria phaeospora]